MLKSEDIAITSCRTSYYDPKYMLETKNELKPTQFLVRENWDLFSAPTRSVVTTLGLTTLGCDYFGSDYF